VLDDRQAATLIQALYRSHKVRRDVRTKQASATRIQAWVRGMLERRTVAELRAEQNRRQRFLNVMARNQDRIRLRGEQLHTLRAIPATDMEKYEERRQAAATRIQSAWRGRRARGEFCRRRPELEARHSAAARIQEAFRKSHSSPLRGSTCLQQELTDVEHLADSIHDMPLRGSLNLAGEIGEDGHVRMTDARKAQLTNQVERRMEMMRAARQIPQSVEESSALDRKLQGLLRDRERMAHERRAELQERGHKRAQAAIVFTNLQKKHVQLADIPKSAEPHNFVLPPQDSLRMARARHEHASMLAQEKAGTHWWKHLRALNQHEEELDDNWTIWDEMDNTRSARWARVIHEEQIRDAGGV